MLDDPQFARRAEAIRRNLVPKLELVADADAPFLLGAINDSADVTEIVLDGQKQPPSRELIEALCDVVSTNPHLRHLTLHDCPLLDIQAALLGDALSKNQHLHSLTLNDTDLNATRLGYITRGLTDHPAFDALDVSHNPIGDAGLHKIASLWRREPGDTRPFLRHLAFSKCDVGLRGAKWFAREILHEPGLLHLGDLRFAANPMGSLGECTIADMLPTLPDLIHTHIINDVDAYAATSVLLRKHAEQARGTLHWLRNGTDVDTIATKLEYFHNRRQSERNALITYCEQYEGRTAANKLRAQLTEPLLYKAADDLLTERGSFFLSELLRQANAGQSPKITPARGG